MAQKLTFPVASTYEAAELLRNYPLTSVTLVIAKQYNSGGGGPVDVTFIFENGDEITIVDGFSLGYGGTGPWGLHDILMECGFSKTIAQQVFSLKEAGIHHLPGRMFV